MKNVICLSVASASAIAVLLWQPTALLAQHSHGHGHGHGHSHGNAHNQSHGHGHHSSHIGHHFVLPHVDRHHHHGTYWVDSGQYYYQPQTYVANPGTHIVAKPIAVEFGSYSHVDDLAGRLERLANELCLDLHYNYSHNSGFAEAYREAYQILNTAKYIHAREHQSDRQDVARRLAELDPLFHHVSAEVARWSRQDRRQVGQAGLMGKLETIEATMHHLMNDVGVRADEVHAGSETAPAPSVDEAAPPPSAIGPTIITTPPPSLQ